jgi:hypothetical protein
VRVDRKVLEIHLAASSLIEVFVSVRKDKCRHLLARGDEPLVWAQQLDEGAELDMRCGAPFSDADVILRVVSCS